MENRTPYIQHNFVVTLFVDGKCQTDCLSIDSKTFPKLLEEDYFNQDANKVICLRKAAADWYETLEIGIINFWYQGCDQAYLDKDGNVVFE